MGSMESTVSSETGRSVFSGRNKSVQPLQSDRAVGRAAAVGRRSCRARVRWFNHLQGCWIRQIRGLRSTWWSGAGSNCCLSTSSRHSRCDVYLASDCRRDGT